MEGATLIVVPVLRRPFRVVPLYESVTANTPRPHRVVFACTEGDTAEIAAVDAVGCDRFTVEWQSRGDYARKINTAYQTSDEPFLFLGADDLKFYPGWLEKALARMTGLIGVVGTNDLGNPRVIAGRHATHSLVARSYVDEFGTIDEAGKVLHEGYVHEFVDDELVGTAKKRGAWAFAHDSIVEHLHPHWGKSETDDIYEAQAARMRTSGSLFRKRRRLWT